MQTQYKGRMIQADESDVVLPSAMGGDDDRQNDLILLDGQDVTAQVGFEGDLDAKLARLRSMIDAGQL
ncbi:hypothetical protein [Deinococcus sp.]|uniref:hypothetical protein n=1 Tax=Deinococcus sp. TaxID=47478 RepID=UPI003B5A0B7F